MNPCTLSSKNGPVAHRSKLVEHSLTSTQSTRKWPKSRIDWWSAKIGIFSGVIASVFMIFVLVGFFRLATFGNDFGFTPSWQDKPACWVLDAIRLVVSDSPTIDPDGSDACFEDYE